MYESILRVATGDPSFSFKLRSSPYPPTQAIKIRLQSFSAGLIVFVSAIAYSVIITSIVSYLVVERTSGLKHLQVISGMQLKAYWIGNFIVDFAKMQLTIAVTIAAFFILKMGMNQAWIAYLVFPVGILPFAYISSFLFSDDNSA
jgi:ATP-binding cassette subfamily A (ABC1) protein 3